MNFLLDTNIVSEARRPMGDQGVKEWLETTPGENLFLSVLIIGEIELGIARLQQRDLVQAAMLDRWLTILRKNYASRILPVTLQIAERWGPLNVPDRLPLIDGLLAATALVHDLTLVTRNTRDVAPTGVRLFNPFENRQP
jgi:predicted nucleic acid-binding protein